MTSYGPWIQADDYTATNETNSGPADNFRTEYDGVDGPYGTVSAGTYTSLTVDVNSAPASEPHTSDPFMGEAKFGFGWVQDEITPQDLLDGTAIGRSAIGGMREMYEAHSASPYTDGAVFFWPGMDGGPGVPAGVVGVQWEGMEVPSFLYPLWAPAEVVGLTITGKVWGSVIDSMNTEDTARLSPGSVFTVAVIADQAEAWDSGTEPPEPSVVFDNDLTDHGDWDSTNTLGGPPAMDLPPDTPTHVIGVVAGPVEADYIGLGPGQTVSFDIEPYQLDEMGRTILYTQMVFDTTGGAPSGEVPLGGPTTEQPAPPGFSGGLAYGYHLQTMTCEWTLRPRRYRWVYARGAAPPLRLYPRDDNLGNSPRLYPPPRTRQRSNRISGYL